MADVTPELGSKPVFIAGYGQNRKATKIHDPLFARAIVVTDGTKKVALAAVDVVGLQYPTVQEIRRRLKGFDYVMVASTHNHEGPDTVGLWGSSPFKSGVDDQYLEYLVSQTVRAIEQADQQRKVFKASYGTAEDERLLRDSRQPQVKDGVLRVVRIDGSDGKPRCLVVNWTCHPEALASRNTEITADFPYYTLRDLEKKYDCPAIYFSGAVGGLMAPPRDIYKRSDGSPLEDGSFEYAERYGSDVAQLAVKAVETAEPLALAPIAVSFKPISVPLENPLYRAARMMGVLKREGDFDAEVIRMDLSERMLELPPADIRLLANQLAALAQLIGELGDSRTKPALLRREDADQLLAHGETDPHSAVDALKWLSGFLGGAHRSEG